MTYWQTNIKEVINWFPFLNIMEYNTDRIDNDIKLLLSMLKTFSMFQMSFKYDNEHDDENNVKIITIRCINFGKKTGLSTDNMKTNLQIYSHYICVEYIVTPCWYIMDN